MTRLRIPVGRRAAVIRARLTAGVILVGALATLPACTGTSEPQRPPTIAVDPHVPLPSSTAESSLSTTFALITDYGNCDDGERQVADMVASWPIRMVATAGDNTQGVVNCVPYQQSVGDYYGPFLGGADGARFFPVPGNHDIENAGAGEAAYLNYFRYLVTMSEDPRWYKVNTGNVNLFMLDSELAGDAIQTQKSWLEQALKAARAEEPAFWNVIIVHRPPFSSGPHEPNTAMRPDAGWDYQGWGADLVVSGHQHVWEELRVDGLPYVVAGAGASDIIRGCPATLVAQSKGCFSGDGAVLVSGFTDKLTLEYRTPDGGAGTTKASLTLQR